MPINPFHEGAAARVAPASIDDLEAGVTLNTTYDDAWGADAPKPREPQSDDELRPRVPHLRIEGAARAGAVDVPVLRHRIHPTAS